ncbi:hypothetical protein [Goodfellowiella coeruleoviolacea]|uniref:Uncharacterized protein n=1 Tax=Goodfellowiella coeruleoviolacea TaxID=334858 RepID=A0AAE3GKG8_9PSEU|nr:hypothetical protein [Goodfellowiella coeruleoviolacea]MCP2169034.1 hypothetical protein [Goodfellowiella coeruleoviolacea]
MNGTPARTAVENDATPLPSQVVPIPELPATQEELAASAAERLGWQGTVLPQMTLMGRRVVVIAELLAEAHAERVCLGAGPVADRTTVATWVWPEMEGRVPPAAVRLVGVVAAAKHWRTALASVVPFARYGHGAIVLPAAAVLSHDYISNCLPRARRYGVTVLSVDQDGTLALDLAGRQDNVPVEDTAVTRWVNELVYERVLATTS